MKDIIDSLVLKMVVTDNININHYYKQPMFDVSNRRFFQIWVNNKYSLEQDFNGEYASEILTECIAGYNDINNEIYNEGASFNGSLKRCKEMYDRQILNMHAESPDDGWLTWLDLGFSELTQNYISSDLQYYYAGTKASFMFRSLITAIGAREGTLWQFNYQTAKNIGILWAELCKDPRLAII